MSSRGRDVLSLRVVPRVRDVPQKEWDALAMADPSPFLEWTWLDCLEEAGCVGEESGWLPMHLVLERGDRIVAVAPAYAKTNSEGEFVFDWSWADLSHRLGVPYYPKLVLGVPFTPATGGRLLVAEGEDKAAIVGAAADALRRVAGDVGASSVHVLFPPHEEAALWERAGYAPRHGVQFHWRRDGAKTWDDYLAQLPSKRRTQIRREAAQPAKDGVTLETLSGKDALGKAPDVVRSMFDLYSRNVDKHFYGRQYLNERFFELVAARFADRLAWVVAKKDGEILAGAFNVRKGPRLYGRYWGTKVDMPFLHFNVCYYRGVRDCLEAGIDVFEPGAGGEHKRVRGFAPTLTYSAHWIAHPRLRAILEAHLERERQQVDAFINASRQEIVTKS